MVLPLVKLGSLAFRTLSKPIAARLKHNAGIHPKFRGFIIGLAQANHRFTTNMQRRLYGRATDIHIRPLNEEKAIQAAADLLVAGAAIIYEVQRSARAEARKEEIRKQEIEARKQRIEELASEVQMMKQRISEIERQQHERRGLPNFRGITTAAPTQAASAAAVAAAAAAAAAAQAKHQQLTAAAA